MYPRALDEPDLKGYFDGIDMDLFNAATLGGPGEYQGRAIGEAHARPSITGHAFDRVATPVVAILRENGVDEDTVGHIADSLGPLRRKSSPCSRSGIENPHGTEGARGPATAIASLVRKADEISLELGDHGPDCAVGPPGRSGRRPRRWRQPHRPPSEALIELLPTPLTEQSITEPVVKLPLWSPLTLQDRPI